MKIEIVLLGVLVSAAAYGVSGAVVGQSSQSASASTTSAHGGDSQQQGPHLTDFPERPQAPKDVIERGKGVYSANCAFCHGSDAGGGATGPNLQRSGVVLADQSGELISPIVHGGRSGAGMPRIDITDTQIVEVAAWLHSIRVASRTGPPEVPINIVTGDAKAGSATFKSLCGSCHSVTGDLKGFAAKFKVPRNMQQEWMLPGGPGGRAPDSGSTVKLNVPPTTVTVTTAAGEKVDGRLTRIDDFVVSLKQPDGTLRSFSRDGESPKVEIHDPLAAHRALLFKYSDKQIHDITAYLVSTQ